MQGIKTYLIVALAILSAALGYLSGEISLFQALEAAGAALGIGGIRAVAKVRDLMLSTSVGGTIPSTSARMSVAYLGVAVTIITALLAWLNGQQPLPEIIAAILGALGINFLAPGVKRAVQT